MRWRLPHERFATVDGLERAQLALKLKQALRLFREPGDRRGNPSPLRTVEAVKLIQPGITAAYAPGLTKKMRSTSKIRGCRNVP